jgi:ribosome-associated heat shock protein Hsp15
VEVEGDRVKPHREVKIGQRIVLSRPYGRKQHIIVRGIVDRHVPKADARALYEDVTPPPSPEEQAIRDLIRQTRQYPSPVAPDKRARRELRRIKESGG